MTLSSHPILALSPHKGVYKASAAISFDYESSAVYGDTANWKSRVRGRLHNLFHSAQDLSFCYGLGYAMRSGAENIQKIFRKYDTRGTWFATGHAILKQNKDRQSFRIDQSLPYATPQAGFSDIVSWREKLPTFCFEKFSDYTTYPYWYLGDQTAKLSQQGNDVQCHTFSHPYVPLEPPSNLKIDIEDWQNAARLNGFQPAQIFAFPFAGDCYRHYHNSNLKAMHWKEIPEEYELCMLSDEALAILVDNGIEVVTRCASKNGQSMPGFAPYRESGLYFMADFDIAGFLQGEEAFSQVLSNVIEKGHTVDFWLHPSNVFTGTEVQQFEKIVRQLVIQNQGGNLWFAPISELWRHFQQVQKCSSKVEKISRSRFCISVRNCADEAIEELSVDKLTPGKMTVDLKGVVETKEKIVIGKLNPCKEIRFDYEVMIGDYGDSFDRTTPERALAS